MACGSCKTCVARCSNHPVSCGHAPSQRPSPMISQKLSEPLHNLPMKPEPALADLHRIPDATTAFAGQEPMRHPTRPARWAPGISFVEAACWISSVHNLEVEMEQPTLGLRQTQALRGHLPRARHDDPGFPGSQGR